MERNKQRGRGLLAVFVLLVLVSGVLAGSLLGRVTAPSQECVIPLAPAESDGGSVRRAFVPVQRPVFRTVSVQRSAQHLDGALQVQDQDSVLWETETQVDLFRAAYGGSVLSENGRDKLLAPGTGYDYEFSLLNNGGIPLKYTVTLEVEPFGAGGEDIPLRWRLLGEDGEPLGTWKEYGSPESTLQQASLAVGERCAYTLQWSWAFERGDDEEDTALGNEAAFGDDLGLTATIRVTAEGEDVYVLDDGPGGGDDDEDDDDPSPGRKPDKKPGKIWELLPETGDGSHPLLYLVMLLVSVAALLLLFLLPGRKKDEDQEK